MADSLLGLASGRLLPVNQCSLAQIVGTKVDMDDVPCVSAWRRLCLEASGPAGKVF